MPKVTPIIFVNNAIAYSAQGEQAIDIFSAIETHLLAAEPSALNDFSANGQEMTEVAIEHLAGTQNQQRIRRLLQGFIKTITPIIHAHYSNHNTQVWLQLPDTNCARSLTLNEKFLLPLLCTTVSPLREFEINISHAANAVQQAAEYLTQRDDLQQLLFISIDSLINVETAQETEAQVLGEAAVCLVLCRQAKDSVLSLAFVEPRKTNTNPLSAYSLLNQIPVNTFVNCHSETSATLDRDYQIEQTYLNAPFAALPSQQKVQKVDLCQLTGDTGVSNFSLGILYTIGRLHYAAAANETVLLTNHDLKQPQILLARRNT